MITVKRVRRIAWNVLSYGSAVLLATIALWVRSYWAADALIHVRKFSPALTPLDWFGTVNMSGEVCMDRHVLDFESEVSVFEQPIRRTFQYASKPVEHRKLWSADFYFFRSRYNTVINIPHWAPAIAFSILPAIRLIGFARRRKRLRAGHCRSCGYDLRATPDRCPECGATPGAAQ